jgi:hypothetical protein
LLGEKWERIKNTTMFLLSENIKIIANPDAYNLSFFAKNVKQHGRMQVSLFSYFEPNRSKD